MRIANEIAGDQLFLNIVVTSEDTPVLSSCNFPAPVTNNIEDFQTLDVLLVCSGETKFGYNKPKVLNWLRQIYHSGAIVGGISNGFGAFGSRWAS